MNCEIRLRKEDLMGGSPGFGRQGLVSASAAGHRCVAAAGCAAMLTVLCLQVVGGT